jgi:hypothetical protein
LPSIAATRKRFTAPPACRIAYSCGVKRAALGARFSTIRREFAKRLSIGPGLDIDAPLTAKTALYEYVNVAVFDAIHPALGEAGAMVGGLTISDACAFAAPWKQKIVIAAQRLFIGARPASRPSNW